MQRLAKVVETLQGQMVAQDQRIESLTNKMIVLKQSRGQDNSGSSDARPELQVVMLQPDEPFESDQESEEPIVLRLRGTPERGPAGGGRCASAHNPNEENTHSNHACTGTDSIRESLRASWRRSIGTRPVSCLKTIERISNVDTRSQRPLLAWECHFESSRPGVAVAHYERVFTDYPKHTKAAGALLKTGLSYKNMKRVDDARTTFSMLLKRYPQSAEAELARVHLSSIPGGGS